MKLGNLFGFVFVATLLSAIPAKAQSYPMDVDPSPVLKFVAELIYKAMPESSVVWESGTSMKAHGRVSKLKELEGLTCQGTIQVQPNSVGRDFFLCTFDRASVTSAGRIAIEGLGAELLARSLKSHLASVYHAEITIPDLGIVQIRHGNENAVSVVLAKPATINLFGQDFELRSARYRLISCREDEVFAAKGEFEDAPIFKKKRMICEIVLAE